MAKRSDLEVRDGQLNVSPREWAVAYPGGAFILGHGPTSRTAYAGLAEKKKQRLALQIEVSRQALKKLVDDAGTIVAVWLHAPPAHDIYSDRQEQAFINASIDFLEKTHRLSPRGNERPRSGDALAEYNLPDLALIARRQRLIPLMKLINPAWHDSTRWDVRAALKMAHSLSDRSPHGEDTAGDYRDRLAADSLVASWWTHTKKQPSIGESRKGSPFQFYMALLGDGTDEDPSLTVKRPQGFIKQEGSAFDPDEIQEFRRVVIRQRALRRAIQRWLKDLENRHEAT